MVTLKLLQKTLLFFCIVFAFINCETTEDAPNINYQSTVSNASFVAQQNKNKVKTAQQLQGVWQSSKSGDKYKWEFDGDKLAKNIIYSFGEVGQPQSYQVKFLNGFDGEVDEFGDYIHLQHEGSEKGISYKIVNSTEQEVVLQSKFSEKIVLKK